MRRYQFNFLPASVALLAVLLGIASTGRAKPNIDSGEQQVEDVWESNIRMKKERRRTEFTIRRVYKYKPKSWKEWPRVRFGAGEELVYLIQGAKLEVIDWRSNSVIRRATYSDLTCPWADGKLYGWEFVPGSGKVVANFCGSLYLIDDTTLKVERRLYHSPPEFVNMFTVSADGKILAASTMTYGQGAPYDFVIFDMATYEIVNRWNIDADGFVSNPEGTLLAVVRDVVNDKKRIVQTGIEVRRVPSGELYSKWWSESGHPPSVGQLSFVPGSENLLAANVIESFKPYMTWFWDVTSGRLVKKVVHEHNPDWNGCPQIFVPDWGWAIGSHVDDPQDTDYVQEFIICDPWTGELLYESKKKKWTVFDHLAFAFGNVSLWGPRATHSLVDLSRNGKYLLVSKYKHIAIYEITATRKQPHTNVVPD